MGAGRFRITTGLHNLTAMPNKTTPHFFVVMTNCCNKSARNAQSLCGPLNNFLRKSTKRFWLPKCPDEVGKVNSVFMSDPESVHNNPQLPIIVSADDTDNGINAVLLHKPFRCWSKRAMSRDSTLAKAEKKLRNRKRAMGVSFAVKRFTKCCMGDYQPLLAIFHPSENTARGYETNRLRFCYKMHTNKLPRTPWR